MRTPILCVLLISVAACDRGPVIEGTLLDSNDANQVWIDGQAERIPIEGGRFRLGSISDDSIVIRFANGDESVGSMRIAGAGASRLALGGIWFDDGLAFPSDLESSDRRVVTVNGLRMASPELVSGTMDVRGTVLALDWRDGNLVVRPTDSSLPDLKVRIGPEAVVERLDGEFLSLSALSFGDSVAVRGTGDGGYVQATQLVLAKRTVVVLPPDSSFLAPPTNEAQRDVENQDRAKRDSDQPRKNGSKGRPRLGRFRPGSN